MRHALEWLCQCGATNNDVPFALHVVSCMACGRVFEWDDQPIYGDDNATVVDTYPTLLLIKDTTREKATGASLIVKDGGGKP